MGYSKQYAVNTKESLSMLLDDLITTSRTSVRITMNIWIDIVKPHHIFFFKPVIEELRRRGNSVSITAGESQEVVRLLDEFKIPYSLIGNHIKTSVARSLTDVFKRGTQLKKYARYRKFDLALIFNSPSLALAAKILHIPAMVLMDYEYEPLNQLMLRLSDKVVVPSFFPDEFLLKFGAFDKIIKYNGFKEQVYLSDFQPRENFLHSLDIDKNRIIVTARPPNGTTLYQRFANGFFYKIIDYLLKNTRVIVIAIPRSEEQRTILSSWKAQNITMLERPCDLRNLLYSSDIVLSAGGTMNHESAVLGIPTYALFMGKIGAVDRHLINLGRITPIESFADVKKIQLTKAFKKDLLTNRGLTAELVHHILNNGT